MDKRVNEIIKRLKKQYPGAKTALKFSNPLEILVATILSAQCTDARVNAVTEKLFKKYRVAQDYASVTVGELEQDIRSTGFYRSKAKNIAGAARRIVEEFNGKVPDDMDKLLSLPGVARKTANVVLGNAFGKVEGIVVDTHVIRLSNRLGLTSNDDPVKIEQDLMKIVPRSKWFHFAHFLQALGRDVCVARNPRHSDCVLKDICPGAA
ncbi:MAG: endonuclease III [Elusimicrobia bacterium RIFOXYA2_FULL_50_26]|nr:MAG: endonuclease III [Elusimicrobia bacterium RIFOXYA2_FULL_50_26]OGS24831.1 MAG: endonuclease III [Elusimicrobia bacterium RIFOXYB2_FULL_50_12]